MRTGQALERTVFDCQFGGRLVGQNLAHYWDQCEGWGGGAEKDEEDGTGTSSSSKSSKTLVVAKKRGRRQLQRPQVCHADSEFCDDPKRACTMWNEATQTDDDTQLRCNHGWTAYRQYGSSFECCEPPRFYYDDEQEEQEPYRPLCKPIP